MNTFLKRETGEKKIIRQRAKQLVPREENLCFGETVKLLTAAIEIGIRDTSKGSLEPVRGSKLPVNVGKDITTKKVSIFSQKTCRLRSGFWEFEKLQTYLS